jgi:hypothetical protein
MAVDAPELWIRRAGVSACGGRFRLVTLIETPSVIQHLLRHLGLPTDVPAARPSRAPPAGVHGDGFDDDAA